MTEDLRKTEETVFYVVSGFAVIQEFDDNGCHRIHVRDTTSDWVSYESIATVHLNSKVFASTADYYGSVLPRVFEIIPPTTIQPKKKED